MMEHFYAYMVFLLLFRLKKVGSNFHVLVNS